MQLQTRASPIFFQIFDFDCNTTMLLSSRRAFCTIPAISLDRPRRAGPNRTDCGNMDNFFFSPSKGCKRADLRAHRAQGDANGNACGTAYRVTSFNGYRFAKSRKRTLKNAHGRTLGNPFDRVDIQADERHVRNALVISNRVSASRSSPQLGDGARRVQLFANDADPDVQKEAIILVETRRDF